MLSSPELRALYGWSPFEEKKGKKTTKPHAYSLRSQKWPIFSLLFLTSSFPPDLSSTLPILNSCPILKSGNATIPNTLTHICQVTDSTSPSAHQKEIIWAHKARSTSQPKLTELHKILGSFTPKTVLITNSWSHLALKREAGTLNKNFMLNPIMHLHY